MDGLGVGFRRRGCKGRLARRSVVALTPPGVPHDARKLDKRCAHPADEAPRSASDVFAGQRRSVVRGGVEPPTFRFSGGRSYQLSYLTLAM
jgi:hypothetical protein